MFSSLFVAVLALASFSSADAASLEGRVLWNELCPSFRDLGYAKVELDAGLYSASIKRDGTFSINDVDEGSYQLSVNAHDHAFDTLRVDVYASGEAFPDVHPLIIGTPHDPPSTVSLPYPIILMPRQKSNYFVEKQSFNALGMLQNPMVLMMGGMGILVIGLPYLIKNMDPEIAKELNQRQARMNGIQSAMQSGDLRGGLSALMSEAEGSPSASDSSVQANAKAGGFGQKSKGGKNGRRK